MFKVGDRVILIHNQGVFTLEKNVSYEIAEINQTNYYRDSPQLRVVDDEQFYNIKRFKIDIRHQRSQKIKKMKWKNQ